MFLKKENERPLTDLSLSSQWAHHSNTGYHATHGSWRSLFHAGCSTHFSGVTSTLDTTRLVFSMVCVWPSCARSISNQPQLGPTVARLSCKSRQDPVVQVWTNKLESRTRNGRPESVTTVGGLITSLLPVQIAHALYLLQDLAS